jgi:uracil-DNA glycosylase
MEVRIEKSWKDALADEFGKPYFESLVRFLHQEKAEGKKIFPPGSQIFRAFDLTPLDQVKVVILGQDPYHGEGQAHGLCFSVKKGVKPPPSLINIFKEIHDELGIVPPNHGELTQWAKNGVLLLNTSLTVRAGQANSHQGLGWETFTDRVISLLNENPSPMVFLLWGANARKKQALLNNPNHLVLSCAHPSPLSAYNGFFGCGHFKACNDFLASKGIDPVDWEII